jgi:hypothetical protein
MDARFYNSEEIDIERLANDLVNVYLAQGYQAQQFGNKDQMLVQLKKGGDFEALIGMQAALSLTIQRTAGGVLAMVGSQKWLDKAAVGAVGIVAFPVLWPLALTAGAGALRQASLANQALNMVDGLVRQQRPGIQIGPIPVQIMPQVQQQYSPPQVPYYVPSQPVTVSPVPPPALPAPAPMPTAAPKTTLRCPNCNTPYEEGDTFCSGCGRSLKQSKTYCPNCHAELKPNASFCPNCGASTFQTGTQPAQPGPQPPATYTPPQTPVYTPPAQQTPPAPPQPTITARPSVTPQPAPQEPYYVPPPPQEPTVVPQPKVTIVPATPKQDLPVTAPKPPTPPQKQYYIPSTPSQSTASQTSSSQPAQPAPIGSKPASKPGYDPNAPWGTLVFADGQQVQLTGERAVVGRYDHDIEGIKPEVDLSKMPGADTVSRIHAVLEHIGSAYTLMDLNSTNSTRLNGKRLEPDKATPINDGDTLNFGKVTCTFKKI